MASSSPSSSSSSIPCMPDGCVMASPISSTMACCSRSSSLTTVSKWTRIKRGTGCANAHGLVDLVDGQAAVDFLHGLAGILHGLESLLVYVGRLYVVNLALQRHYLTLGLLQRVLVLLLAPQGSLGRWTYRQLNFGCLMQTGVAEQADQTTKAAPHSPVLFPLTCFRARASWSLICDSRCFSRLDSISSCSRKPSMAFFGASLRREPDFPANQL